jgi:amino acid adenylation domain-containing protein
MAHNSITHLQLPPEQEAIRAKCFHPSGVFTPFPDITLDYSVPHRFQEIARIYPDRVAIETSKEKITFGELNKIANRLAHTLVAQRGSEREPVALYIDHPVFAITAHMGVLKAGRISLFIDPADSLSRINHLLENAQVSVMITKGESAPWPADSKDAKHRLIHIDRLRSPFGGGDDDPKRTVHPEAPAYIRYTSGSTGRAKGAVKTHRHIMHSVQTQTNYFHLCENDRFAMIGRDYLGKRTFEALLNGATLYPFDIKRFGLHRLAEWLIEKKITACKFFPTAFRNFISILSGNEDFKDLRLVHLEGEPIYRRDVDLYKKYLSTECVLVNSYSSTETGPISFFLIDKNSQLTGRVPIGYPIEGVEVCLVDEVGEPVGVNQPGEIVVKSSYLSDGYWRYSDLDAAQSRWKKDSAHGTAYFTGDLGSMSESGCLEHLGRKDTQVKIRSFRVDIGEVEATLASHPEVKEAAVIAKETQSGDTRLIAYFVPIAYPPPTVTNLLSFFKDKLPDYMIPSIFMTLEEMPLTRTGKVNHRALPNPTNCRPELGTPYVAPRTVFETDLERIWASVLSLDQVGVHDNFFELGGNSLAATSIIAQAIRKFQLDLPLQSLFRSPTVAEMSTVIAETQARNLDEKELDRILTELESLSGDQVEQCLVHTK